jgi:hypothetical protein
LDFKQLRLHQLQLSNPLPISTFSTAAYRCGCDAMRRNVTAIESLSATDGAITAAPSW